MPSAGLIVTEGIQPSLTGQGYPNTPGLHTSGQVAAWRQVTDAVHREDGVIFAQLMHTGRIGHPSLLPEGLVPVGPSAVAAKGQVFTHEGPKEFVTPKELSEAEIRQTIADFADGARNAIEAGFDGVELHGANGYLIHQFLAPNTNGAPMPGAAGPRGGSASPSRSPPPWPGRPAATGWACGSRPATSTTTWPSTTRPRPTRRWSGGSPLDLAYLHLLEGSDRGLTRGCARPGLAHSFSTRHHPEVTGPEALQLIEDGAADIVAYGALFLANPDLPARLAAGGPCNSPDQSTFYGGDHRGYTDYPALTS